MARLVARRMKKTTSKSLTAFIWVFIVVFLVLFIWAQNNYLTVDKHVFKVVDLPKSFVGYKVVHISDMNNSSLNVVGKVKKLDPNIILISGGFLGDDGKYDKTKKQIKKLCKIAPVYYTYNIGDGDKDILSDTDAINLTDNYVELSPEKMDLNEFIKDNYGKKLLKTKGDKKVEEYLKYVLDELTRTKDSKLLVIGLDSYNYDKGKYDALSKVNSILESHSSNYNILLLGNLKLIDEVSKANVQCIFSGGTYGVNAVSDKYTKGHYGINGSQLFVSGGVGNDGNINRILNLPEVQCITLSDGTIVDRNPIERFFSIFYDDVGNIFDGDEGFKTHTYTYN